MEVVLQKSCFVLGPKLGLLYDVYYDNLTHGFMADNYESGNSITRANLVQMGLLPAFCVDKIDPIEMTGREPRTNIQSRLEGYLYDKHRNIGHHKVKLPELKLNLTYEGKVLIDNLRLKLKKILQDKLSFNNKTQEHLSKNFNGFKTDDPNRFILDIYTRILTVALSSEFEKFNYQFSVNEVPNYLRFFSRLIWPLNIAATTNLGVPSHEVPLSYGQYELNAFGIFLRDEFCKDIESIGEYLSYQQCISKNTKVVNGAQNHTQEICNKLEILYACLLGPIRIETQNIGVPGSDQFRDNIRLSITNSERKFCGITIGEERAYVNAVRATANVRIREHDDKIGRGEALSDYQQRKHYKYSLITRCVDLIKRIDQQQSLLAAIQETFKITGWVTIATGKINFSVIDSLMSESIELARNFKEDINEYFRSRSRSTNTALVGSTRFDQKRFVSESGRRYDDAFDRMSSLVTDYQNIRVIRESCLNQFVNISRVQRYFGVDIISNDDVKTLNILVSRSPSDFDKLQIHNHDNSQLVLEIGNDRHNRDVMSRPEEENRITVNCNNNFFGYGNNPDLRLEKKWWEYG